MTDEQSIVADFIYEPDLRQADAIIDRVRATRVLYLGGSPETGYSAGEARRASTPAPVVSSGVYAIRDDGSWDVVVCVGGLQPGRPTSIVAADAGPENSIRIAHAWLRSLWPGAQPLSPQSRFAVGDHVRLAGTERTGRIDSVIANGMSWRYTVTIDGQRSQVPEDGLEAFEVDLYDPESWVRDGAGSARQLATTLTFTKLSNPLTDTIYSYLASKTIFRPYQFRPVLRMLGSPYQRLLVADEVGLGKTIEAGLIWLELEQRTHMTRVLVVCPAGLVPKWQTEMKRRFDRELEVLDRIGMKKLIELFNEADDEKPVFGVVSLERLRSQKVLEELESSHPRFDLVVVDEAHYLRNSGTLSYELGRSLSAWSDALVFLSATPLNLGHQDLFNLLNLLVEDEYNDPAIFPLQVEPNRHLNALAGALLSGRDRPRSLLKHLDDVRRCELGGPVAARPEYQQLRALLSQDQPLEAREIAQAKQLLGELNTLSNVLTRTRKIDVPDAKAIRQPESINVTWTDEERGFYNAVLEWARRRAKERGGIPGFVTQMPLRQTASCIPAMQELLKKKDPALFNEAPYLDDFDDIDTLLDSDRMTADEMRKLLVAPIPRDSKYEAFERRLEDARAAGLRQVMVFSFFRRTLAYLSDRLGNRWTVRVMDGGTPMPERQEIMRAFRAGEFEILLCSEVGSEGLDFEFCNVLVNYDLPWNPMKVEQRIGRLDRFGQEHEKIFIYNFHVPGTIETEIFERLYRRINVFKESIGELEPILRDEIGAVTKLALDPELTDEQRELRLQEIEVAIEKRRGDVDDLKEAQSVLSGLDQLLIDGLEADTQSRGHFVGGSELRHLLEEFFADGTTARLRATKYPHRALVVGDRVVADQVARVRVTRSGSRYRPSELAARLRDSDPLPVTFDNADASRSDLELISLRHPLVRAAVQHFAKEDRWLRRFASVSIDDTRVTRDLVVVIYLAETTGVRPSLELWPVAVDLSRGTIDDEAGYALMSALARGELQDATPVEADVILERIRQADQHAADLQDRLQSERKQSNEALVDARIAATNASFLQKISRAESTLATVRRARRQQSLVRLYEGRIHNLELRRDEEADRLDQRRNLAVVIRPVAVALVRPPEGPDG